MPLGIGMSVVRRTGRQHGSACEAGGFAHPRSSSAGRGGVMDLSSRLRAIVKSGPPRPVRELTYEPDTGRYETSMDLAQIGAQLGGRPVDTPFGRCLVVDRRYEADRWHGGV